MIDAAPPIRIAMWSGPRNISTAMMRAFENRGDCAVSDEPFYAAYLPRPGLDHPMRDEVIASQPNDWRAVADGARSGRSPSGKPIWYQKHMTHHMVAGFGARMDRGLRQRLPDPRARGGARLLCAKARRLRARGNRLARAGGALRPRRGSPRPRAAGGGRPGRARQSRAACSARSARACGIGFSESMLAWPKGRRASDGVWAPAWYEAVEKSRASPRRAAKSASRICPMR